MRTTSEVTDTEFPYDDDAVPFILVAPGALAEETKEGRGFEHGSTMKKKTELLEQARKLEGERREFSLLAPWPGKTRTDVFLVDDLDAAEAALLAA